MSTIQPLLVDTRTACQLLGCRKTKLFEYLRDGVLVRRKIGRKTVVPMDSIRTFVGEVA